MKIITVSTGNAKYIEIQYKTFKKYMKTDYEFIVVNACVTKKDFSNFGDENILNKAKDTCEKYNIKFINFFDDNEQEFYNNINNPSARHSFVLRYIVNFMKDNADKYLIIDSDMFLIDYFDIEEYNDYYTAIVIQEREYLKYVWPGFFYINMKTAPMLNFFTDFNLGLFNNIRTDTGGGTCKWLHNIEVDFPSANNIRKDDYNIYNKNNIKYVKHLWSLSWDESEYPKNLSKEILNFCKKDKRNQNNKYFSEIYDKKFFHVRAGSGWMGESKELHDELANNLYDILID
jgi:hypothetical protein